MDDTTAPSGTPIRWLDPGADAVQRHSRSFGNPIRGRPRHLITIRMPCPERGWSALSTTGGRVSIDSGPVGEVYSITPDATADGLEVKVLLDIGIEPSVLAGLELRFDFVREVVTVERIPAVVRID